MNALRRTALVVAAALSFFVHISSASCTETLALPIMRADGSATRHTALIRTMADERLTPDIWVPAECVDELGLPVSYYAARKYFTVRVERPAERLGAPVVAQLAPNAVDLCFAAKIVEDRPYLNISDVEAATGAAYLLRLDRRDPRRSSLTVGTTAEIRKERRAPDAPDASAPSGPFALVWDHVTRDNADLSGPVSLPRGCVISPTWFHLADEGGAVTNRASVSYVRAAHARGMRVWALFSNASNRERTTKFLADAAAQRRAIASLLSYSRIYGFDGINIDFEAMDGACRDAFTSFVRSLADAARACGLSISIDITVPAHWQKVYDRPALAAAVDFVALMAYDQHPRTSKRAGSVASLPWVREKLALTLEEVPANKLLLGAPLYTRLWEESGGEPPLRASTLSMPSADAALRDSGAARLWLDDDEQSYFEYARDNRLYRVWMEDERSMRLRLELVARHGLAGVAFWRWGFETPEIWSLTEEMIR